MRKQSSAAPPVQNPEPEFAAFVAIDGADQKHDWTLQVPGSRQIERGQWDNTPEAIEVGVSEWHLRFGDRLLAVALEQCRGALVSMLSQYGQLH